MHLRFFPKPVYYKPLSVMIELRKIILTIRAVAASVLRRAAGSVLASALLRAVFSECVCGAQLAAILSAISGRTNTCTIDGRALCVVLAVTTILTTLAKCVEGTRSGAGFAVPSHFAGTLSGPRVTQLRMDVIAFANLQIKFYLQLLGNFVKVFRKTFTRSRDSPLHKWDHINRPRKLVDYTFYRSIPGGIYRYRYWDRTWHRFHRCSCLCSSVQMCLRDRSSDTVCSIKEKNER